MGTLCTSPTQYSETRNQPRDLSGAPRSCLFTTRPTVRFPALRGLPGGVGMSVSTGLIGPVRHAVGERPLFAHSRRPIRRQRRVTIPQWLYPGTKRLILTSSLEIGKFGPRVATSVSRSSCL